MAWHTKLVVGGGSEMRANGKVWWVWNIGGRDSGMGVKGWPNFFVPKGLQLDWLWCFGRCVHGRLRL